MKSGPRDKLIEFYRAGAPVDDGYTTQPGAPALLGSAWAEVRFGTGQERREAAQEAASVAATFIMLANPITTALIPSDTLRFMGADWDISSSVPGRDRSEWQVTATRQA